MTEIVQHCPLCGSPSSSPFDERQFRGQQVSNVICRECGLVYQSPRMTEAESRDFYETEYRLLYQGQEGPSPKDLKVQSGRARVTLEFARRHIPATSRLLDIGCSTGILLQQFQQYYHAQVVGVEPGNLYRQYAQASGLEVYASLEELQNTNPAPFSLVSLMHVLEHLPNPVEYLQELRTKLLDPDGWLLLEVPNLYAHDCFETAHLVSFSPHSLLQVVQKAGYRLVARRAHGMPRSTVLPLYLTLVVKPGDNVGVKVKPEHQVKLKRRAGLLRRKVVQRLLPQQAWIPIEKIKS